MIKMPFDRESFLKGYFTGLNMSRAPGGQGRKPDIPNAVYILKEDGNTPIMTESFVIPEGVSSYKPSVNYMTHYQETPLNIYYNELLTNFSCVMIPFEITDSSTHPIIGYVTPGVYLLLISESQQIRAELYQHQQLYTKYGLEIDTTELWHRSSELFQAGENYIMLQKWWRYPQHSNWELPGVENRLIGSFEEMEEFVASLFSKPLITEDV